VWLDTPLYKMALYDSTNVLIWTVDNIGGFATLAQLAASGGAALIGYLPASGPATTVQAALIALQEQDVNLTALASINGGQIAGLRNRIINGSTTVSQRGTAFTPTLGSIYTVDRWYLFTSGAVQATVQRQLGGGPNAINPNFMTVIGAAGNTSSNFGQRIEAVNSADMSGQVVTLSAWVYSSDTRLVTLALNYATAVDNFTSTTSITATSTTSVSATGWRYVTSKFTVPSTQNGLEVGVTFGAVGASIQVAFTGVQLEIGSVATTFEQRPIGLELALCQRYYETGQLNFNGQATNGVNQSAMAYFKVTKRVAPTFSGVNNSVTSFVASVNTVAITTDSAGIYHAGNATAAGAFNDTWTAYAEL